MPDRELVCVGLDLALWDVARDYLQPAIERNRGEFELEDIYNLIRDQKMQLWGLHDGALKAVMVTEIVCYPRLKRLRVVLIGGHEMDKWLPVVMESLDRFKEQTGCDGIELLGRRGWVKQLAEYGYQEYETVVIKQ